MVALVVAAAGVYLIVEEGFNDKGREASPVPSGTSEPRPTLGVVVDAYPSNVPAIPGGDVHRVPAGYDVPGMVEPTTDSEAAVQAPEVIDVVPTGSDTSVFVPEAPSSVELTVCAYDWDCATAMRIVACETGRTFDPGAVGAAGERGWFQIHPIHWGKPQCSGNLFDPVVNTACAYSIWAAQGWWPWSCY